MEYQKVAFITGISGQDGSLLAECLLKKDYMVIGLLRTESNLENISEIISNPNLELIYGDLMNAELLRYIFSKNKIDEVYNLASQSNVRFSYQNPVMTFNVTLTGTVLLIDSIKKYSPSSKVFQAGSSSMFGNSIDSDGYQREITPFRPISPYASSKLFAHNICQNYRVNDGLYISNGILYNHESSKLKSMPGIINTVIRKAIEIKYGIENEFYIPNLNIPIDCGHAVDYVYAMWICLQQKVSDDYIIATGKCHTIESICDYVFTRLELDYRKFIKTDRDNVSIINEIKGDSSKIKSLGWVPKYSFTDTIDDIFNTAIKKIEKK